VSAIVTLKTLDPGRHAHPRPLRHFNASTQFAPFGVCIRSLAKIVSLTVFLAGWFHGAKQNFNLVTETVSTLRAGTQKEGRDMHLAC
jgi:hypothetical protein